MNNSVFAQRHESGTNERKYFKLVMQPSFKDGRKFSKNLSGMKMGKTKIKQGILNLSMLVMYEFHYDYMVPKYGQKLQLFYMDTDSFVYHGKMHDFYKEVTDINNRTCLGNCMKHVSNKNSQN